MILNTLKPNQVYSSYTVTIILQSLVSVRTLTLTLILTLRTNPSPNPNPKLYPKLYPNPNTLCMHRSWKVRCNVGELVGFPHLTHQQEGHQVVIWAEGIRLECLEWFNVSVRVTGRVRVGFE